MNDVKVAPLETGFKKSLVHAFWNTLLVAVLVPVLEPELELVPVPVEVLVVEIVTEAGADGAEPPAELYDLILK